MTKKIFQISVYLIFLSACFLLVFNGQVSADKQKDLKIINSAYLGQKLPGMTAEIFAPGFIATGLYDRDVAISPEGDEIYFSILFRQFSTIMVTRRINDKWTEPEVAPFASDLKYNSVEPAFSPDGKKLYFLCTRPREGQKPKPGWGHQNIWYVDRLSDGLWSEPKDLGAPVNTEDGEYFPSFTKNGTLYFTRSKDHGKVSEIWRSRLKDGKYTESEKLPAPVNAEGVIYNASISPDESFLLACVSGRKENENTKIADYFVFFRDDDDRWIGPYNLGKEFNPPGERAISINITLDGKYIFFASTRGDMMKTVDGKGLTMSKLVKTFLKSGNNMSDIYWIDAKIVDQIRPKK